MRIRCCVVLALSLVLGSDSWADVLYSVADLSTLIASDASTNGINNAGQIVGHIGTGTAPQAFIYSNGQVTYLGAFGPSAINDFGQVSGSTTTASPHAVLYSSGQLIDLGTLGGSISYGDGINNAGEVTGGSALSQKGFHAFIYSNGNMTDLGTLAGDSLNISLGYAINNSGQVTGATYTGLAFLYNKGQMINLGTLGGASGSAGNAINNVGQVTGYSSTASGASHAFLYNGGQMIDLGTLGGQDSLGADINNAGQVVGSSSVLSPQPAFYSSDAFLYSHGAMMDLNNLIDPMLGIRLYAASSINDLGQILATGAPSSDPFKVRSYLLTPVPEPHTLELLGLSISALLLWSGRRRADASQIRS